MNKTQIEQYKKVQDAFDTNLKAVAGARTAERDQRNALSELGFTHSEIDHEMNMRAELRGSSTPVYISFKIEPSKWLILRNPKNSVISGQQVVSGIRVNKHGDEIASKGADETLHIIDASIIKTTVPMEWNLKYGWLEAKTQSKPAYQIQAEKIVARNIADEKHFAVKSNETQTSDS